ncbi:MAG: hypothetical protein M1338_01930 [Patescibacteria group bacterium]|nr:hypothetical protein [Patescibacteria group bacterium]
MIVQKLRPNFWKDQLWFYPVFMIVMQAVFNGFFYRISTDKNVALSMSVIIASLVQPIFLLLFLDNISNTVYFERGRVIFKGFLWKKIIPYQNIQALISGELMWPVLIYLDPKTNKPKSLRLFVWDYSIMQIIRGLEEKRGKFTYDEKAIQKAANRNFWGKIWFILIVFGTLAIVFFSLATINKK